MIHLERYFQLEGEWNILHIPEQPNGFAIMFVGDGSDHFVTSSSSLWLQSPQRSNLLKQFLDSGYTVFYSNLFGRNWGSTRAVNLLKRLYHQVIRQEIVNKKIHILGEGMGGLTALRFQEEMQEEIRSIGMLSPCLDLKKQADEERQSKLFYKRFIKELSKAYDVEEKQVETDVIKPFYLEDIPVSVPIKIWHSTDRVSYPAKDHSRKLERLHTDNKFPVSLSLHLLEKRFELGESILSFFHQYEQIL